MTEKTQQTEVPQPVQWAVNIYAVESQRAAKLTSDIARLDKTIAQLTADRKQAVAWQGKHTENAESAWRMAERECAENGWTMPPVPEEAPLVETGAFPAQNKPEQNGTAHTPVHCQRCTDPLHAEHGNWLDRYNSPTCDGGPHVPVTVSGAPADPHPAADTPAALPKSDPTQVVDLGAIGQGGGDRG